MSSATDQVLQDFYRFRDAIRDCDTRALKDLMAEDYLGYNLKGHKEGRDVILSVYRPGEAELNVWEVSDLEVAVFMEVALISGTAHVAGTFQGTSWSHDLRFCDVWKRSHDRWQLYFTQATPMGVCEREGPNDLRVSDASEASR